MHLRGGIAIVSLCACSTFESTGAAGADAGVEGGVARGCPKPLPENTTCWDFDDGLVPSGELQNASFAIDDTLSFSPSRSLLVTTKPLATGTEGWARLQQVFGAPQHTLVLDERLFIAPGAYADCGELKIQGKKSNSTFYTAHLTFDDLALKVIEGTLDDGTTSAYAEHALPSVSSGTWAHVVMRIDFIGYPGASAQRHLVVTVNDGPPSVDTTDPMELSGLDPAQMLIYAGITYIGAVNMPRDPRTVSLDDVLMSWTP